MSSSINFDFSFNSQTDFAGQDNCNFINDQNSVDFNIHDNLHVNNDSVMVKSDMNNSCVENLNVSNKPKSEDSKSNRTPQNNTDTSDRQTPEYLKRTQK